MVAKSDLHWILGAVFLLLPGMNCESLQCYFCSPTPFNKTCKHVLSECAPLELCYSADGRFGRTSVLFAKGCMARSDCVRPKSSIIRGNNVTFTYSCCDFHYCNSSHCVTYNHILMLIAIVVSVLVVGWNWLVCLVWLKQDWYESSKDRQPCFWMQVMKKVICYFVECNLKLWCMFL